VTASQRARACLGVLAVLLVAGVGLLPAASAASTTVNLTSAGPSRTSVTINRGDTVVFHNVDTASHTVKAADDHWTINAAVPANGSTSWTFNTVGSASSETFTYTDTHGLLSRVDRGQVVVNAPKPSPSPKPSATRQPTPKPSATQPSATPPTASPTPDATVPTSQVPTSTPLPAASHHPIVAGPPPAASPSTTPAAAVAYAGRPLVQGSPHRYGLPAALAVVGITGVASLLLRLLLAEPAVRRRRTRLEVSNES
jgi:plastocyanin